MNKKINRTNRNYIIIGLCTILLIMGVGYAAFSSQLKISGTSNIGSSWNVKITSITPNSIVGTAENKKEVTTYNDTSATFGVSLKSPGDSITYDITIVNQGTIDAVLKTITKTDASNSAILFETSGVNEGDELKVGETATMKVKVTYNPEVTSQPNILDSTLKLTLDYAQKGTEVVPGTNNILLGGKEVEVVTSGDGLYADEYEAGRYIYKGNNPNNYITFNGQTWRILSKESDGSIKVISNEVIANRPWDANGNNDWSIATLKDYLNGEYLNDLSDSDKIISHNFDIGAVKINNDNLTEQINSEKSKVWNGKVGLITASEYIRANSNKAECGSMDLINNHVENCIKTNWIYSAVPEKSYLWFINPTDSSNVIKFVIGVDKMSEEYLGTLVGIRVDNSMDTIGIVSTLHLTSNITLEGSGTNIDPYVITN